MGLESWIQDIVIRNLERHEHLEGKFKWRNNSFYIEDEETANEIIGLLNVRGEFGPMFFNSENNEIKFGKRLSGWDGDKCSYYSYYDDFVKGEIA